MENRVRDPPIPDHQKMVSRVVPFAIADFFMNWHDLTDEEALKDEWVLCNRFIHRSEAE